jgi:hypothetical protein
MTTSGVFPSSVCSLQDLRCPLISGSLAPAIGTCCLPLQNLACGHKISSSPQVDTHFHCAVSFLANHHCCRLLWAGLPVSQSTRIRFLLCTACWLSKSHDAHLPLLHRAKFRGFSMVNFSPSPSQPLTSPDRHESLTKSIRKERSALWTTCCH